MCLLYKSFENTMRKGEIARNKQISPVSHSVFYLNNNFLFHQIQNCPLQSLSVWKSLKFVVWEMLNHTIPPLSYLENAASLEILWGCFLLIPKRITFSKLLCCLQMLPTWASLKIGCLVKSLIVYVFQRYYLFQPLFCSMQCIHFTETVKQRLVCSYLQSDHTLHS